MGDDNDVVLYAGGDQWWATRVWWLLRTIGFDRAAVLDGGFKKWRAEGRALSTATTIYAAAPSLTLDERRGLFTGRDSVVQALESSTAVVVNCLREELHKGTAGYHYGRPGHITGSVNVPATALFAPDGTFKPLKMGASGAVRRVRNRAGQRPPSDHLLRRRYRSDRRCVRAHSTARPRARHGLRQLAAGVGGRLAPPNERRLRRGGGSACADLQACAVRHAPCGGADVKG